MITEEKTRIEPLPRGADYFSVMGVPRKLGLDPRDLEPVYHQLSRRYHPDRYRLGAPRERLIALENSSLLNQAYRTLRDPFERAAYLLKLEGAAEAQAVAPTELFDEILEVQELLGEFHTADPQEREALLPQLAAKRDELRTEQDRRSQRLTGELFGRWDAIPDEETPERERLLEEIGAILSQRAYLRRVLNSLNDALAKPV
jgi:molecular chaperone HscB